jgi:hypothetical protein
MASIKVEGESTCRLFLRPMPSRSMNEGGMHCHTVSVHEMRCAIRIPPSPAGYCREFSRS